MAIGMPTSRLHNVSKPPKRPMRVITLQRLREYAKNYPDAAEPLEKWYQLVRHARWDSLQEVRRVFPHADSAEVKSKRTVTIFSVGGNNIG